MYEKTIPGNVLLSHQVALTVPSALEGLTAVFGMGTGVTPPPWSPGSDVKPTSLTTEESSSKRPARVRRRSNPTAARAAEGPWKTTTFQAL